MMTNGNRGNERETTMTQTSKRAQLLEVNNDIELALDYLQTEPTGSTADETENALRGLYARRRQLEADIETADEIARRIWASDDDTERECFAVEFRGLL